MKCIIFTQRVEVVESYGERRDSADQRISEFIYECGFLPIPVPNVSKLTEQIIHEIKPCGIILTGGNSLVRYGGNAPERDEVDARLISISTQENIPLYGFCRGMQSILSYFGNTLVNVNGHAGARHFVMSESDRYEVNSYHNQACINLRNGCGLVVTAQAEDGVIEAVKHEIFPIIGTMWHPEREEKFSGLDIANVRNLFHV